LVPIQWEQCGIINIHIVSHKKNLALAESHDPAAAAGSPPKMTDEKLGDLSPKCHQQLQPFVVKDKDG